jgi:trimethylamine--corrinoid protein Co-methyltransferase
MNVLDRDTPAQVHAHSLEILGRVGVRVETQRGRAILQEAGAQVDEVSHIVRFPKELVEEALRLAPRQFRLGGRRPDNDFLLNAGDCALMPDGGALFVFDAERGERRMATYDDFLTSTRLVDALDELELYWWMARPALDMNQPKIFLRFWRDVFGNTSKHVQDSTETPEQARWLLEILQAVFGGKKAVRKQHPFSWLICPLSPLTLEGPFMDAYLETVGWDIPLAAMPMPLMGMTAPGRLAATLLQGNCEVLAVLCLQQAASPGAPFIYAPALSAAEPHSGRFTGGAVEHALLGAAVTEMGRYYGLPVQASTGSSDIMVPGVQSAYERALNWTLPAMSWPDILVGPGLLDGATTLSIEQLMIDLEVYARLKRLRSGIDCSEPRWLEEVIEKVGPQGSYLAQRSTGQALRGGEWQLASLGFQGTYEAWKQTQPDILAEARQMAGEALAHHQPLPLDDEVVSELEKMSKRL